MPGKNGSIATLSLVFEILRSPVEIEKESRFTTQSKFMSLGPTESLSLTDIVPWNAESSGTTQCNTPPSVDPSAPKGCNCIPYEKLVLPGFRDSHPANNVSLKLPERALVPRPSRPEAPPKMGLDWLATTTEIILVIEHNFNAAN